MTVRRRTLLKALGLPVAAGLTACSTGSRNVVRIAVPWSSWEMAAFRMILSSFTRQSGIDTEVVPLGDDIGAALDSRNAGSPDVVMVPRPGIIRQYFSLLEDLDWAWDGDVLPRDPWYDLFTEGGRVRAVLFKAAYKSAVWFDPEIFDRHRLSPPADWAQWERASLRLIDAGMTPLALGGADGWVLTDFFENALLGEYPNVYAKLSTTYPAWNTEPVLAVLNRLGRLWSVEGMLAGGISGSLLAQHEDALVEAFTRRRAAMVADADFAVPVLGLYGSTTNPPSWFRFPPMAGHAHPLDIGGDAAALPAPASDAARALVGWLVTREAAVAAVQHGFLSLRRDVPTEAFHPEHLEMVRQLRAPSEVPDTAPGFDLSDRLDRYGGSDGDGLGAYLQDFLADIDGGGDQRIAVAATRLAQRMDKLVQSR